MSAFACPDFSRNAYGSPFAPGRYRSVGGQTYRIRTITEERTTNGLISLVYAEAELYDLAYVVKQPRDFNAALPLEPIAYALEGTGWSPGVVNISSVRSWECLERNVLAILRETQRLHGGDLVFDPANRLVHLKTFAGNNTGAVFAYGKNLTAIKQVVDTRSLFTRVYAVGKDGMTFANINNGKDYVEDYGFTAEVKSTGLDCSNFDNPYQMLEFAKMRLADYFKPRISYVLTVMDLSALTGYEHEAWSLGDIVTVFDNELNIKVDTRVVRLERNVIEPWQTVIELSTKLRELGSTYGSGLTDDGSGAFGGGAPVRDLVPFNHLLNSRGDDGFTHWDNNGFTVDVTNGVSGTASFRTIGANSETKSMAQRVCPANRNPYTISAQIGSADLVRGENARIGIEVEVAYQDGETETRFIDLF